MQFIKKIKRCLASAWNKYKQSECSFWVAIVVLYTFFSIVGIGCPIKFLTGVSCAGCGMTRAWWHLFALDFEKANYYHPFWSFPILMVWLFVCKKHIPEKVFKTLFALLLVFFLIIYIIRMINTKDNIVVFAPQNGIVFRIINYLF